MAPSGAETATFSPQWPNVNVTSVPPTVVTVRRTGSGLPTLEIYRQPRDPRYPPQTPITGRPSITDVLPLETLPFGFRSDNIEAMVPPDATVSYYLSPARQM